MKGSSFEAPIDIAKYLQGHNHDSFG